MKKKNKKKSKEGQKLLKKLIPRAGSAMKDGFYLEAILIISTLMESYLRTVITKIEIKNPGRAFNLEKCLRRMKNLRIHMPDSLLERNFEMLLINRLRDWKNHKNAILKDLILIRVSRKRMEKYAYEGIILLRDLDISYKKFKSELKASLQVVPVEAPAIQSDP
jgi:hypothetical protein